MKQRFVSCFEDIKGNRLDINLINDDLVWEVSITHIPWLTKQKNLVEIFLYTNEKKAKDTWRRMEEKAKSVGWTQRVVVREDRSIVMMKVLPDGTRLFRDPRTGELFQDESSNRPPPVGAMTFHYAYKPKEKQKRIEKFAFTLENLPRAKNE